MGLKIFILPAVLFGGIIHAQNAPAKWLSLGSIEAGDIAPLALASNGESLFIAYSDYSRDGKTSVRRYEGGSWILVGKAGFSAGIADNISLIFNKGQASVSYRDASAWGKVFFAAYAEDKWLIEPVSRGEAFAPSLILDKNGMPALSFRDESRFGKAVLMRKAEEGWVNSGVFERTFITSAAFDSNNTPYFAHEDYNNNKTAVLMQEGGLWKSIGSPSRGIGYGIKLAYDGKTGILYAAFREERSGGRLSVASYGRGRWKTLKKAGLMKASDAWGVNLIAVNGNLYLPCITLTKKGSEAAVMRYKNGRWEKIGGELPPAAEDSALSLTYDGMLYLAYRSAGDDILIFSLAE